MKFSFLDCLFLGAVVVGVHALSSQAVLAQTPAGSASAAKILEKAAIPGNASEMVLREVVMAPGGEAMPHHHSVAGLVFIVEGVAESAYGDDAPKLYRAGETLQDRADVPHTIFRNADKTKPLRFLTFYAAPKGQSYVVIP